MKNQNKQNGFIPLMILLLLVVAAIIWFVFQRVSSAQH
jgi:hypothetical protein